MQNKFKFLSVLLLLLSINSRISTLSYGFPRTPIGREGFMEALSYSPAEYGHHRRTFERFLNAEISAAVQTQNSACFLDALHEKYVVSAVLDVLDQEVDVYRRFDQAATTALAIKKKAHTDLLGRTGERYQFAVARAAAAHSNWQTAEQAKDSIIDTIDAKTDKAMKDADARIRTQINY